jgi:PAS domain S-box-containing protein
MPRKNPVRNSSAKPSKKLSRANHNPERLHAGRSSIHPVCMDELRYRTEESLASAPLPSDPFPDGNPDHLRHELALHQAELLIQNEELRESQHDLAVDRDRRARIFEHSPFGDLVLGADGTILEASRSGQEMFAFPEGAAGLRLGDFILPQDRASLAEALAGATSTGLRQVRDLRYTPHQSRELRHLRLTLSVLLPDGSGDATSPLVLALAEDVTDAHQDTQRLLAPMRAVEAEAAHRTSDLREMIERKAVEEAMREGREHLSLVVDSMDECLTVLDGQGNVLFANAKSAKKLFGVGPREAVGRNLAEALPKSPLVELLKDSREVLDGERSLVRETQVDFRGKVRWFRNALHPIRFGTDRIPALLSVTMEITQRKEDELKLREQASFLESLIGVIPCPLFIKDRDGRYIGCNQAFAEYVGRTREEILGKTVFDMFESDTAEEFTAQDEALFRNPERIEYETSIRLGPDMQRHVRICKGVYQDHKGDAAGVIGVFVDITKLKDALTAHKESEQRVRAILDSVQAGVVLVDPRDRRIVEANPAACRLMGFKREEIVGQECHRHFCPAEHGKCPVLDLGQDVDSSERSALHASGRLIPVLKTVNRVKVDGREMLLESFMDLSERVRSEEVFRGVSESASDAIYLLQVTQEFLPGRFLDANPAACRMLGYTREELLQLSLGQVDVCDSSSLPLGEIMSELVLKGQCLFEVTHRAKDGRPVPVEVHARFLEKGSLPMILSLVRDVSRRKQTEAEMVRAHEAAVIANRTKSEFLANMSHELRTPLNGVMGMLQLLDDTPLDQEQRQFVGIALQSARGMLALVNDLLDLSRIEAGRMSIEQQPVDLRGLLDSISTVFDNAAQTKGLSLRCTLYPGVPGGFLGDVARLRQVLLNLVGNAVKFTEKGEVGVTVAALSGPEGCGPPRLLFSVSDTGPKISREQLARLFKPFVQADGSMSRRHGGAGLGLALCRRLLALMGAHLTVDTEPGQGADFTFVLPLHSTGPLPAEEAPPVKEIEAHPLRVLLAEDEPVNQMAARLLLERLGHQVSCANDGEEALEALAQGSFDCVLLDISMPKLNGIQVLHRQRVAESARNLAHVPAIALTAHAMLGDRERFLAEGFDGYLAKPIETEALARALGKVIAGPGKDVEGQA